MPRPRKNPSSPAPSSAGGAGGFAEQLGEALGRGFARGLDAGFSGGRAAPVQGAPRRGRPPKIRPGGPVPADRLCKVPGCGSPVRSKGLCSRHYQAARRGTLKR